MKAPFLLAAFSLATFVLTSSADAWGKTGHRVVCEIAFQELDSASKSEVVRLISTDTDFRYFYDSCLWPDDPRQRSGEHYINIPRDATNVNPARPCGPSGKCVVTAIMEEVRDLSLRSSDRDKLEALKFLGHWVGDIHQPLHVSFSDDRGGNSIEENGPCKSPWEDVISLHSVWDSCIIERELGTDPLDIALDLQSAVTGAERDAWTADIDQIDIAMVSSWADESFAITTSPDVEYCVLRDGGCYYSATIDYLGSHDPEKTVRVDSAYTARNAEAVSVRLKMAGVRLGALLNVLLDN